MKSRWSRRSVMQLAASGGLSLTLPVPALARQSAGIESGGIGMTLPDWEAVFGPGEAGQSYMMYTYPAFGATMHVGSRDDIVDYFYIPLENSQFADGMDGELAQNMTMSLLPHDARLRQAFQRNETPGSIIGVSTGIWISHSLGYVLNGRRAIMVRSFMAPSGVISRVEIDVEQ